MQRSSAEKLRAHYLGVNDDAIERGVGDLEDFAVETEPSLLETIRAIADGSVDCVLCERESPSGDWRGVLSTIRRVDPGMAVVLFTDGDDDLAERALEAGVTSVVRGGPATIPGPLLANRIRSAISVAAAAGANTAAGDLPQFETVAETVGDGRAAVEHEHRAAILAALHRTTRQLIHAETAQEIAQRVVDAAASVLELSEAGIFLFDSAENVLEPAAISSDLLEFYGEHPQFGPEGDPSITWNTYVSGETRVYDDVREAGDLSPPAEGQAGRSGLFIPLGDHGVFVAGSAEVGVFDEPTTNLVNLLAATTEAALDRVARETELHERDRRLRAQNDRLTDLNRINEIIRDVHQSIITAASREGIEQAVCDRLTEDDRFRFAWIGALDPSATAVTPRTWAGQEKAYLDSVSLDLQDRQGEPASLTATARTPTVVDNVATDLGTESWRRKALSREFQSAIAVPLEYGEMLYGVLAVYAKTQAAFSGMVRNVLAELGETVAYAINACETKRGLMSDQVVELDLRVEDPDDPLHRLATAIGATVSLREIQHRGDDVSTVLVVVEGASPDAIVDAADGLLAVEEVTALSELRDGHLVRASITGRYLPLTLVDYGGAPEEVLADGTALRAVVDLPGDADVHAFVDRVREQHPTVELAGRRDHERSERDHDEFRADIEAALTDRQQEVLQTAYLLGYFESPRELTGADVAEALDISQPTLNYHLRTAERKTYELLFGDR